MKVDEHVELDLEFQGEGWDPLAWGVDTTLHRIRAWPANGWLAIDRPVSAETITDEIVRILLGSKQDRFRPRPDPEGKEEIRSRVMTWVANGEPIQLLTMWGAIKHYVRSEDQGVDLAEFFAALTMRRIRDAVARVYPPGVVFKVVVEDFGVWYQDAYRMPWREQAAVVADSEMYVSRLRALFAAVGGAAIQPRQFAEDVKMPLSQAIASTDRNYEAMEAYWNAEVLELERPSAQRQAEAGAAFEALESLGWTGRISAETRQHYERRISSLYPAEPEALRLTRVLRYLATVLLYEQIGLQQLVGPGAIRCAFYKPAPGLAKARRFARLHFRSIPRTFTSAVMPPWVCKGCWYLDPETMRSRPRIESFRELWASRSERMRGKLVIRGVGSLPSASVTMDAISSLPNGGVVRSFHSAAARPQILHRYG